MITIHTASKEDIDAVIYDDEIYDRITDDNCPPKEDFVVPYDEGTFIGGYVDGKIAGLFAVHGDSRLHFMVLRQYRRCAAALLEGSMALWNAPVYVVIATLYQPVINFAKKHGFIEVGRAEDKTVKRGVAYPRVILERGGLK